MVNVSSYIIMKLQKSIYDRIFDGHVIRSKVKTKMSKNR